MYKLSTGCGAMRSDVSPKSRFASNRPETLPSQHIVDRGGMVGRKLTFTVAAIAVVAAGIYVNNTTLLATHRESKPVLLAHRGTAQRFDERDLKNATCTAARMLPPTHDYLENTIRSIRAGFASGADIVEIDVHPTTEGEFAVFHDWTLDCRTDGRGVTREHPMAKLKR